MKRWAISGLTVFVIGFVAFSLKMGCHLEVNVRESPPGPMGWNQQAAQSEATRQLVSEMPKFRIRGTGNDNSRANIRLWEYFKKAGLPIPKNYPQEVGDCVSFGAKRADLFAGRADRLGPTLRVSRNLPALDLRCFPRPDRTRKTRWGGWFGGCMGRESRANLWRASRGCRFRSTVFRSDRQTMGPAWSTRRILPGGQRKFGSDGRPVAARLKTFATRLRMGTA